MAKKNKRLQPKFREWLRPMNGWGDQSTYHSEVSGYGEITCLDIAFRDCHSEVSFHFSADSPKHMRKSLEVIDFMIECLSRSRQDFFESYMHNKDIDEDQD